jgi:hypothetical protein
LGAALSLADGAVIADPFRHTAELVELLRIHSATRPTRRSNLVDGWRRDRARRRRRRPVLVG